MFDNIGEKIKKLAVILVKIGFVLVALEDFFIIALNIYYKSFSWRTLVFVVIYTIFALLFVWITKFTLYGFGVLICNSETMIEQNEDIIYKIDSFNKKINNYDDSKHKINTKPKTPFYDYYNTDDFYDMKTDKDVLTLDEVKKRALIYPADECKKYVVNSYFSLTDAERKKLDPIMTLHYNDFYDALKKLLI